MRILINHPKTASNLRKQVPNKNECKLKLMETLWRRDLIPGLLEEIIFIWKMSKEIFFGTFPEFFRVELFYTATLCRFRYTRC
jgi:hypothetical protein